MSATAAAHARRRALLTVSGTLPDGLDEAVAGGRRPRVDYIELAAAFDADLVDHRRAATRSRFARVLDRTLGPNAALAWWCFRTRRQYEVIVTDGEQVGLPFALLARARPRDRTRHLMIVHIMSVSKKALLFRAFRLLGRIDGCVVYSSAQRDALVALGMPADAVTLSTFMVDTTFFDPAVVPPSDRAPVVCAAGLELRDYDTMLQAVAGLPMPVVVAAASPWSKRKNELSGRDLPPNVSVVSLDQHELRQLYADAAVVVMPLRQTDFQAGITTILEAMSMARPIVCSRTIGQTDTIIDRETGRYVAVGDAAEMRQAIDELLADRAEADRLGDAARRWVIEHADIDVYASRLARRVAELARS